VNPIVGWSLAAIAVAVGWMQYGWRGVVLAVTVIVFWLLLQFSRALRAMKLAGSAPVGCIGSAVMLNAQLKAGMTLLQVIQLTRSLGRQLSAPDERPERWEWADEGGARVTLELANGRLKKWELTRPAE
jgi:hypothetical protein